jgi:mRNA interferase MazF
MVIQRGEVWWADFGGSVGTRPVLVLTRDEGIRVRRNVTVAPVTTTIRSIPTELELGPADGLPRPCVADLDSLQTIRKSLLRDRITSLTSAKLAEAEDAVRFALAL